MSETEFQFDESVQRALEKWPNVPNCFGWMSLDRRGRWLIKNQVISHERAKKFLARNYTCDQYGRWFIQNGPQRVFCDLDIAPLVFHLTPNLSVTTHTEIVCETLLTVILDERGNLLLNTDIGLGLIDDRDLTTLYHAITENPDLDPHSFDFEFVRRKNTSGDTVTIDFNGFTLPVLAETHDELETKHAFTRKPQPVGSEA